MSKQIPWCALMLVCLAVDGFAQDRLFVELFPYASVGNADPTTVRKLLREKLQHLAEETLSANRQLERLDKIRVVEKNDAFPASLEELATYWTKSPNTLEILSGAVFPNVVTSSIYLGELHGSLPTKTIKVQIELTPQEFRSYRDMHGALMLYVLAMDAKARKQDRGVVSQYLAEADSLLRDIKQRPISATDGDVQALSDAVAKELGLLRK